MKPLLIVDEKRCEIYPDIPCTEELGIEATGAQYRAFFATKDTTPEQIQYLNDKMADLQDDPDYLEALEGFGFLPGFIPADEMGAKIEECTTSLLRFMRSTSSDSLLTRAKQRQIALAA